MGSYTTALGYYYVLDTTSDIKPRSSEVESSNYCHSSYYYRCLAFPDINYIIIWGYGYFYVGMYIDAGPAISQITTNMVAKVWINQRYIGTHTLQITPTCWNYLRGSLTSNSVVTTASSGYDRFLGKRRAEVIVTFTTTYNLPASGSVIVVFPSSIPRIYPHCRSMTNLGSKLYAEGSTYNGEVGCLVQNTRQWVITGFAALTGGSVVKIVGFVDLPLTQSGSIGTGEILTVNNTHPTDIKSNGFVIDYVSTTFGISVSTLASLNVDSQLLL